MIGSLTVEKPSQFFPLPSSKPNNFGVICGCFVEFPELSTIEVDGNRTALPLDLFCNLIDTECWRKDVPCRIYQLDPIGQAIH